MAVTKVDIGGRPVGIMDLEECFGEVKALGMTGDRDLGDAILRRVQERNYIPSGMEEAYREGLLTEYRIFVGEAVRQKARAGAVEIRLYGSSCFNCERLDGMVKAILSRAQVRADYLHVTDMRETARAGILATPSLVVNGAVILQGRLPVEDQLERMLLDAIKKE